MPTTSPGKNSAIPGDPVDNCFSMAALRGADGAFLIGEMAPHTFNAGQIYFPAGTPDPDRRFRRQGRSRGERAAGIVRGDRGAAPGETAIAPGWTLVFTPQRIACMKLMTLAVPAARAKARIDAHLARDPHAEFSRMHIVRSPARHRRSRACRRSSPPTSARRSLRDRSDSRAASPRRRSWPLPRRRARRRRRPPPLRCRA